MAKRKWYRFYLYVLLEVLRRFFLILPQSISTCVAAFCGLCCCVILVRERAKTLEHLELAFGAETSVAERRKMSRGMFVCLSKTAVDICRFPLLTRDRVERLVRLDFGTKQLDDVLSRGKGVIALTGHIGNWELLASYFRFLGYPGKLVGRRIYYDPFDRVLVVLRQSGLVSTIYRDESARPILEALRKNQVVGMSADQDIDSLEGIYVPFFGRPSWTPVAPAKISLASGAAIIPMFMIHEGQGYRLLMDDPIWPVRDKPKAEAVRLMTERWSSVVERSIRRYPDQWVWMHDRWKTTARPAALSSDLPATEQVIA